jgi:hypothetical protein
MTSGDTQPYSMIWISGKGIKLSFIYEEMRTLLFQLMSPSILPGCCVQ